MRNELNNKNVRVVRASLIKFKFEQNMCSATLGIRRSTIAIGSSGKSASGTKPACK